MMDSKLWANELTLLPVSMVDSDSMLRGGELRTDDVKPPLISVTERDSVSGDDKVGDEVRPPLISRLGRDSVSRDDEVSTDELTSLVLGKRLLVEMLKTSGLDEETTLLDESMISIGVI